MPEPTPAEKDYAGIARELRYYADTPCVAAPVGLLSQAAEMVAALVTREQVLACITFEGCRWRNNADMQLVEIRERIDALFASPPVPADEGSDVADAVCRAADLLEAERRRVEPAAAQREEVERPRTGTSHESLTDYISQLEADNSAARARIAELETALASSNADRDHWKLAASNVRDKRVAELESALADAQRQGEAWRFAIEYASQMASELQYVQKYLRDALSAPSPGERETEKPEFLVAYTAPGEWRIFEREPGTIGCQWKVCGRQLFATSSVLTVSRDYSHPNCLALYDADLAAGGET